MEQEKKLAERVGFEPTLELPLNTLSKRAPSATRPSLRARGCRVILADALVAEPEHLGAVDEKQVPRGARNDTGGRRGVG